MINTLKQEALLHGDMLQILSADRLYELKNEIELFEKNEELNSFQKWIVNNLYSFEPPTADFTIKSVIIIAVPHPFYAKAEFMRHSKKYIFASLFMSDFGKAENYLNDFLAAKGFHTKSAPSLPMKRLAVQSGLAAYGRNNISYVNGMGSSFSLAAYFSDMPCDMDNWTEMRHAEACANCRICINNCPTGAIREDRFLIDNERCLSFFNESAGEFPEWMPLSVHHCLYDCLKCQIHCPMNTDYVNNITESIKFSEDETEMLLSNRPYNDFPDTLKKKSEFLGLNKWLGAIPRNLRLLFELSDRNNTNEISLT